MMTATCGNCGNAKTPAEYAQNYCDSCRGAKLTAEQKFSDENPGAAESDILYAGRRALAGVAHHANRNFTDPRGYQANRMIPIPPQSGDRGGPA